MISFTPKESEVYALLSQGKQNKVIAHELGVAENTAKKHIQNMLNKANVPNRMQLVIYVNTFEEAMNDG